MPGMPSGHVEGSTFKVQIGARLVPFVKLHRRAFPTELDLDLSTALGNAHRRGFDPDLSVERREESISEVAHLLNTAGARWFRTFDSHAAGLATLEALPADDDNLTWGQPRRIAMQIRAANGELAAAHAT